MPSLSMLMRSTVLNNQALLSTFRTQLRWGRPECDRKLQEDFSSSHGWEVSRHFCRLGVWRGGMTRGVAIRDPCSPAGTAMRERVGRLLQNHMHLGWKIWNLFSGKYAWAYRKKGIEKIYIHYREKGSSNPFQRSGHQTATLLSDDSFRSSQHESCQENGESIRGNLWVPGLLQNLDWTMRSWKGIMSKSRIWKVLGYRLITHWIPA